VLLEAFAGCLLSQFMNNRYANDLGDRAYHVAKDCERRDAGEQTDHQAESGRKIRPRSRERQQHMHLLGEHVQVTIKIVPPNHPSTFCAPSPNITKPRTNLRTKATIGGA
jgi:hypothetical protein